MESDALFEPSQLGRKDYWDFAYSRELNNFRDHGEIGEVWFGECTLNSVLNWLQRNLENINEFSTILDIGCGNGITLINLAKRGYSSLYGIDNSEAAIELAKAIASSEQLEQKITFMVDDILCSHLKDQYNVIFDKGTFDAISLHENRTSNQCQYIYSVKKLLKKDGYFVITSCNFTKKELLALFHDDFKLYSEIQYPTFRFGGEEGSKVTTLALKTNY